MSKANKELEGNQTFTQGQHHMPGGHVGGKHQLLKYYSDNWSFKHLQQHQEIMSNGHQRSGFVYKQGSYLTLNIVLLKQNRVGMLSL